MKTPLLTGLLLLTSIIVRAADTNPPPRLTVDLRDGSRVVGTSVNDDFKFHSELLGDLTLEVKNIRAVECLSSNIAKLTTVAGDMLTVSFADSMLAVNSSFGKVDLEADSVRKISVAPSVMAAPQHEGLVGFWSGNGTTEDSVGGDDGVFVGEVDYAPGPAGKVFNLEAQGSCVKIPKTAALDPGSAVTVEFWMKPSADNAMDSYQGLVTSDFYGVEISNGWGGRMGVNFFAGVEAGSPLRRFAPMPQQPMEFQGITTVGNFAHVSDANGGGAPISAGQWHHVAGTFDGAQLRLYIDGQPWGQPVMHAGRVAPMLSQSFVSIGSEDGRTTAPDCIGTRYFKGFISNIAIYNRALTASEIRDDYEAQKPN